MLDSQELFTSMLSKIKDQEISDFVEDVWETFNLNKTMERQASSSGKYHPLVSNEKNGLAHHTMMTLLAAERIMGLYKPMGKLTNKDCDVIRAAVILHDAWKYDNEEKQNLLHTTKAHPYIAYKNVQTHRNCNLDCETKEKIADAVRLHQSNWGYNKEEITLAQNTRKLINHIVMLADMISSDKKLMEYCYKYSID